MLKVIKSKTFLIAMLFILILTTFRVIWLYHQGPFDQPRVDQGVLDLRNWNSSKAKTINLDGEWEFFPNNFVAPGVPIQDNGETLTVPGKWNQSFPEHKVPAFGFGSYRLKILLSEEDKKKEYGIQFPSIRTAAALYVNGEIAESIGNTSENIENHEASASTMVSTLKPDEGGEIELIIHVSNFTNGAAGGINKSIIFGNLSNFNKEHILSQTMQFLVFIIMVVHSLYAFILFLLRPQKKELLYFALGIFSFSICVVLDDDRLLLNFIQLNYEWYVKIIKFSYMALSAFLLQFIRYMFFPQHKLRFVTYLSILCVVFGAFIIVLPLEYASITNYNYILVLASFITITVLIFRLIVIEQKDLLLILLSAISIISSVSWGTLRSVGLVHYSSFYPYDLILAIVIFSSFWFKRFFHEVEKKEELNEKLKREDELKDQFLANTSHELRNPLHGIINIAESIISDNNQRIKTSTKDNIELLITISNRMSILLDDLIDMTRIKEQGIPLEKKSLHLSAIATGVFDMLKVMIERKPIQFVNHIPSQFPNVIADEKRLIQILYNLVHNAVKYTNSGVISIQASVKNGIAYIHVADTGIGIDPKNQASIFEPYMQGANSIEGGLGLGLSITKQLVEMHGGSLTVKTSPGKGSTFTFTLQLSEKMDNSKLEISESKLPTDELAATTQQPIIEKWHVPLQSNDKPNILAVDDDVVNLKILSNMLPPNTYNLVTVRNAEEALAYLSLNEWDLIIADVMMPNMSGYELSHIIRKRFSISELPILLLTARSETKDILTGFQSGANDYVTKPINGMELRTRVNALTNIKRSINERLQMEAAWLQAQIQPHFLFNTLNAIASLSEIDTERMTVLLERFGQYLQKSFAPINLQRTVPLEHELELLESYLYIEKERFGDKLQIVWELDALLELHIPPLTIQTLVENAVRHGVLKRISGGTVWIRIKNSHDYVQVEIEDNGVGMDSKLIVQLLASESKKTGGIGLFNTNKRLKQAFASGLTIKSEIGKGTIVSFIIPKR